MNTITTADGHNIQRWIDETIKYLGHPELRIEWEWNASFTRRLGDARSRESSLGTFIGMVRFSSVLWPRTSVEQHRETVIHEVCHVVDRYRSVKQPGWHRKGHHGETWGRLMQVCGLEAKRCYTGADVDRTGIARRMPRVQVYCECPNGLQFTAVRIAKVRRGTKYRCRTCRSVITLWPRAEAACGPAEEKKIT